MVTLSGRIIDPVAPTDEDARLAQESSRLLAGLLGSAKEFRVQPHGTAKQEEAVLLPISAVPLLVEILTQMAQGNAVTLIPIHAELTTQQAADLLNVSRPFLIKLLQGRKIPFRKVGKHRRIQFSDLLEYKQRSDADRRAVLRELVADGEELDMGY